MSKEKENADLEVFYKSVRSLQKLGTGRNRQKILVGDSDDARSCYFNFVSNVLYNRPSWNELKFANRKVFNISSQTLDWKPAYIFLWNELTEDLWLRQVEREKLLAWIGTASMEDSSAMASTIVEQTESKYRVRTHPAFALWNLRQIRIELMKMSLPMLRSLNSLIDVDVSKPAASSMAA